MKALYGSYSLPSLRTQFVLSPLCMKLCRSLSVWVTYLDRLRMEYGRQAGGRT